MTAPTVESVATLAGRELDANVAVRLFGWKWLKNKQGHRLGSLAMLQPPQKKNGWRRSPWGPRLFVPAGGWVEPKDRVADWDRCGWRVNRRGRVVEYGLPHYSTDPAAFFAMVKKVRENGWAYTMSERGGKCWAIIDRPIVSDAGENGLKCLTFEQHKGEAGPNQLPLAFARAALLTTINTPKGG